MLQENMVARLVRIIDEYHDTGNWCLIAEKTAEMPDVSFEV